MHTLPDLPYKYKDLEPYIDKETMEIHHDKHHRAYVDNLNKVLVGQSKFENLDVNELLSNIQDVPENIKQSVVNYGGGHANHSFFWKIMLPTHRASSPEGLLKKAIENTFGTVDSFKDKFSEKAMGVFGSGWAFLVMDKNKKLNLKRHSFQNSPMLHGNFPILGIDVWEHAYYLKYQNRRAEYIKAWWNVVNWKQAELNFTKSI